ncbi:MAG: class I SAM-dependent methyltransferase [Alphaproteobacteria bacterium]|nr:class I SAM-dependent methyltransferase [Alphaproteobacteria bacterium]
MINTSFTTTFSKKLILLSLCTVLYSTASNHSHAMDAIDETVTRTIPRYAEFEGLTPSEYIKKALPNTSEHQQRKIAELYISQGKCPSTPIQEDGTEESIDNLGKILPEGGYSFPPSAVIQGSYLYLCEKSANILVIGPGRGDDVIPPLALGKNVIPIDIHTKQLNELKQNVKKFLPNSNLQVVKRNFAEAKTTIPTKWVNGFDLVNLTRVFHFLNDSETKTMVSNVHTLLKTGGYACIAVLAPTPGMDEDEFNKQLKLGNPTPGLIYYDKLTTITNNCMVGETTEIVSYEELQKTTPLLTSPGQKTEFFKMGKLGDAYIVHALRQGRHYHTLETFSPYLKDYFNIVDSYNLKSYDTILSETKTSVYKTKYVEPLTLILAQKK